MLTDYQKIKLQQIAEAKDPSLFMVRLLAERALAEAIIKVDIIKGINGKTPVKGQDYFTDGDIQEIIRLVRQQVRDGRPGGRGDDGIPGVDGKTPVFGIDYWTKSDQKRIVDEVYKLIPKVKEVKVEEELKKNPIEYKDIKGIPDLKDIEQVVKFLKSGGFRGGGNIVVAGTGISVTTDVNGNKVIASTGVGTTKLLPVETPNGTLTVFTLSTATAQPSFIVSDNAISQATSKAGTVNWTWNNGTKKVTMTIPPVDDIVGIV